MDGSTLESEAAIANTQQRTQTDRSKVKKYLIVIEPTEAGYSAYSPDLPGCVSTGANRAEVEKNMHEAIAAFANTASLYQSLIRIPRISNCPPENKNAPRTGRFYLQFRFSNFSFLISALSYK